MGVSQLKSGPLKIVTQLLVAKNYSGSNCTNFPALGAANVSEPRLMSQVRRVREIMCAWISVFLQLQSCGWGRRTVKCEIHVEGCHAEWRGIHGCNPAIHSVVLTACSVPSAGLTLCTPRWSYCNQCWNVRVAIFNFNCRKPTRRHLRERALSVSRC